MAIRPPPEAVPPRRRRKRTPAANRPSPASKRRSDGPRAVAVRPKQKPSTYRTRLRRWYQRLLHVWRRLRSLPPALQGTLALILAVVLFAGADVAYHVARKPSEMLAPVSSGLKKTPEGTWREYGALFQRYSTAAIPPELLAALAQVEGAGNPLAHTYWRWSLTWRPLDIFRPASSAVGMFQMTDATFTDARRYCIHNHTVVDSARQKNCSPTYSRLLPAHAIELTAISLDRQVAAILAQRPKAKVGPRAVQNLAALTHLCGAGPATAYAKRNFRLLPGERCGDHNAAVYLHRVDMMEERFRRLAKSAG